ncbi:ribonuclease HIII [Mycoplasma bradburyae]|uniref:ribonuclease HIII n=1 Tax=Mycoplasma bradburyae TaxID=2963128 RepID=UPI0023400865|nr:ribonuclease HIII [Mycoplasma bradburyae]MDC4184194.1 ribonuclease HIII [Mycoplasma bradburyae]
MSSNTYSIKKLSDQVIKKFIDQIKEFEIDNNNEFVYKRFNYYDYLIISVYKTNSILIQPTKLANSKHLNTFINKYCFWETNNKNQTTLTDKITYNKVQKQTKASSNRFYKNDALYVDLTNESTIGCDEVGVGEYLGPIVTCCALVKKDDFNRVIELGVKDSKQLTDDKIISIANELKKFIDYQIFCFDSTPSALCFNEMYDKLKNINALKAYMHNAGLDAFNKKYLIKNKIVLDEFVTSKKYYEHLNNFNINPIIKIDYMTQKAESKYLSVAVASILARAYYLDICKQLLAKINYFDDYKNMLGSDNKTLERIKQHIKANNDLVNWREIFKVFFKPLEEFLNSLK